MFLENLTALMKARGLNRRQLSIQSGIPYSTIDSMFKISDNARLSTLIKLADFFGVTLEYLVRGTQGQSTPHELAVLDAYRRHPELRTAVDKLLDVSEDAEKKTGLAEDPEEAARRIRAAYNV